MTRHDFSKTTRAMVAKALELGMIDGLDLLALGSDGRTDHGVQEWLIDVAYANRHVDNTAHRALVPILDAGRAEEVSR